jgi:hypothetical protein
MRIKPTKFFYRKRHYGEKVKRVLQIGYAYADLQENNLNGRWRIPFHYQ